MLTVIVQKLLNQIHMGHKHTSAAVSDQEQGIQGIPMSNNSTNIIPRTPVNLLMYRRMQTLYQKTLTSISKDYTNCTNT